MLDWIFEGIVNWISSIVSQMMQQKILLQQMVLSSRQTGCLRL